MEKNTPIVFPNPCSYVRESCWKIVSKMKNVEINKEAITEFVKEHINNNYVISRGDWSSAHFPIDKANLETVIKYTIIIDTLNYCFWPNDPFEYIDLAQNLYQSLFTKPEMYTIENLSKITKEELRDNIFKCDFNLLEERVRMIREVFTIIKLSFNSSCTEFIKRGEQNAPKLVKEILDNFVCYRDTAIYEGEQVFFYKRAQILVCDLYIAYLDLIEKVGKNEENKILDFSETIGEITTFADYIVPQILRAKGIIKYNEELSKTIDNKVQILNGSVYEIELRAASIISVELLKEEFMKFGKKYHSFDIDVFLWQEGERNKEKILPHHRTLSIFY